MQWQKIVIIIYIKNSFKTIPFQPPNCEFTITTFLGEIIIINSLFIYFKIKRKDDVVKTLKMSNERIKEQAWIGVDKVGQKEDGAKMN